LYVNKATEFITYFKDIAVEQKRFIEEHLTKNRQKLDFMRQI